MPQPSRPDLFDRRHHAVLAVLVLVVSTLVLLRLQQGWQPQNSRPPRAVIAFRIDPNTATADEIASIPGVGTGLAERIVAYRHLHAQKRNPVFLTLDDLDAIAGIGPATLDELEPYLTLPRAKP